MKRTRTRRYERRRGEVERVRRYRALVNMMLDLSKLGDEPGEVLKMLAGDAVQIQGGDEIEYLVALCEGGYLIEEAVSAERSDRAFGHHWDHCSHCADYDIQGVSCCHCHKVRPDSDFDENGELIEAVPACGGCCEDSCQECWG